MNLAHRTINNAIFNSLSWVLPIGLSLIFLPYIVHKLGADAYGVLTLIWAVIGYLNLLDLGLGNAVTKYVAEYNARGENEKINAVIAVTFLIFITVGLIGGLCILLISKLLVTHILNIPQTLVQVAYIAFCISPIGFILSLLLSFLSAIPNGLNRYDITSTVSVLSAGITIAMMAYLLYTGYGLIQIVVANFVVTLLAILIYIWISKKLLPGMRLRPGFKFSTFKKVLSFGMYSVLSRISYVVNYQIDRIVIGALLDVSWVTYYVVPFMLVKRLTGITVRMATVIFPAISELQGYERHDTIQELYLKASRIIFAIASSICIPLLVFGDRLLSFWMGKEFGEKSGTVIILLTIGSYLSALTNVPTFVADGLGKPKVSGITAIINSTIFIILMIPLTHYLGIIGMATAAVIASASVTPFFVWYVNNKIVKISFIKLLSEAYAKPAFAGIFMLIILNLLPLSKIDNLFTLLSLFILSSIFYFILSIIVGVFPQQEKRVMLDYFRAVLRKL